MKSPIERVAVAFKRKTGVRFTASELEIFVVSDTAIADLVENILEEMEPTEEVSQ